MENNKTENIKEENHHNNTENTQNNMKQKKVMVSGCFDMLHSGHVAFLEAAAKYGQLYVALGSDRTILQLKRRTPILPQLERLYMLQHLACVHKAFVSRGSGMLDFLEEFKELKPDLFVVNDDGNTRDKAELCKQHGVEYLVLRRDPHENLEQRSSTALRTVVTMPFRIDMAGGWLDQPFVSKHYPGAVITFSIEPTVQFNERSGMASSTRSKALELWGPRLPIGDEIKLAKILFAYDNPPGKKEISGSQDAIGIVRSFNAYSIEYNSNISENKKQVVSGVTYSYYEGEYWPKKIVSIKDESVYQFLEQHLHLVPLGPRHTDFSVLTDTNITTEAAKRLSVAAEGCWKALLEKDLKAFGKFTRESFEAQIEMFPHMVSDSILQTVETYKRMDGVVGYKLSGAGGGGYLIVVSEKTVPNSTTITVRRDDGF